MEPGGPPVGYRLRPETKRYWIKCTIALQILADALRPIVDKTFRDYHQSQPLFTKRCDHSGQCTEDDCPQLHHHVTYECGGCGRTHLRHEKYVYYYGLGYGFWGHKANCPCHDNDVDHLIRRKGKEWVFEGCYQCHQAFDLLKDLFADKNPEKMYWANVKIQNVFSSHWEIAKIFMPRGNYGTDTPEQADAAALLTVVNTCNLFRNRIDHSLADALCKERNGLLHNSTNDVDERTCKMLIKDVKTFLISLTYPCLKQQRELSELNDKEVTAEMFDKALEADIQILLNTISDKKAAGEDVTDLVRRLRDAIEIQTERNLTEELTEEFEKKYHELEKENEDLLEKNKQLQEIAARSQHVVDQLTKERDKLKIEIDRLQKKLYVKNEFIRCLTEEKEKLERDIHRLQSDLNEKMNIVKHVANENEKLKKYLAHLQIELNDKYERIRKLTEEKEKLEITIHRNNAKVKRIIEEKENLNCKLGRLLNELEEQNAIIREITNKKEELENDNDHLRNELDEMIEIAKKNTEEYEKLESVFERLYNDWIEKQDKIEQLEHDNNILKSINDDMNNILQEIENQEKIDLLRRLRELDTEIDMSVVICIISVCVIVFLVRIGMFLY